MPRTVAPPKRPNAWFVLPQNGPAIGELCSYCFRVLRARLQGLPPPPFPNTADPSFSSPIFVTWLRQRRQGVCRDPSDLELRGCMGCLEPVVLEPGLAEYALRSSLQDRRFSPVHLEEVPLLTCRLSILHQFETCSHIYDWQVGLHGILINFVDARGKHYSATYLPEVAREHGMTREVAIRELVAKAGYVGPCDSNLLSSIEVTRYQTKAGSVAYPEFLSSCGSEAHTEPSSEAELASTGEAEASEGPVSELEPAPVEEVEAGAWR